MFYQNKHHWAKMHRLDPTTTASIIKTRDAIRNKFFELKKVKNEHDLTHNQFFSPVSLPLNDILNTVKSFKTPQNGEQSVEKKKNEIQPEGGGPEELNVESSSGESLEDEGNGEVESDHAEAKSHPLQVSSQSFKAPRKKKPVPSSSDCVFGFCRRAGKITMGNKEVKLSKKKMIIGEKEYNSTPGLLELLSHKEPRTYSPHDLSTYKDILIDTGAHLDTLGRLKNGRCKKYKRIIKPLFNNQKKGGELIFWSSADDLVQRLRLILASEAAGNLSHLNEKNAIIGLLKKIKIIR